jgi:hypothetical protein
MMDITVNAMFRPKYNVVSFAMLNCDTEDVEAKDERRRLTMV